MVRTGLFRAAAAVAGVLALSSLTQAAGDPEISTGPVVLEVQLGQIGTAVSLVFKDEEFQAVVPVSISNVPLNTPLAWTARVNGKELSNGTSVVGESGDVVFDGTGNSTSSTMNIAAGVVASESGTSVVEVEVCIPSLGMCSSSESEPTQVIAAGVSIIPMVLVITLAMVTRQVELSLAMGIFTGAWIVTGDFVQAFKDFLAKYIVEAAANESHVYVILFTFFVSALVGMAERAGGMKGLTAQMAKFIKSRRTAQFAAFSAGLLLFFDDYANSLVVGFSMRPMFDTMMLSREKLAFIADATAAPIASIVPISSWVGFEIDLIQNELDIIREDNGGEMPEGLSGSGFTVFVQSIPYRYYPLFMIFLQFILITTGREIGPMLYAERKCIVNRRADGGDGAFRSTKALTSLTAPLPDTPPILMNLLVPIFFLVTMILVVMVNIGKEGSGLENPSVQDIFENTDSYLGLLFGSFAAALISLIFFALQFKKDGMLTMPTAKALCLGSSSSDSQKRIQNEKTADSEAGVDKPDDHDDHSSVVRPVMTPRDSVEAWLLGLQRIFPAIVVLVLAWATGSVMGDVGANRYFQRLILDNVSAASLPSITFATSAIMALATGTSWGTMEICFPIVVFPAYKLSNGDPDLIISVIAAVLSGAVCGDHCSPISDTSVLSSIAADCDLTRHVITQAPYAFIIFIWSLLVGTVPVGNGSYSTGVAIGMGFAFVLFTVLAAGAPIISPNARYDVFTELYLMIRSKVFKSPDTELEDLKQQTIKFAASENLDSDSDSDNSAAV